MSALFDMGEALPQRNPASRENAVKPNPPGAPSPDGGAARPVPRMMRRRPDPTRSPAPPDRAA